MTWEDILNDPADNMDIWEAWKPVAHRNPDHIIVFYTPRNHNPLKYEKRFGHFANLTPERLRGRVLAWRAN